MIERVVPGVVGVPGAVDGVAAVDLAVQLTLNIGNRVDQIFV